MIRKPEKKSKQQYPTDYNLLIAQDLWQVVWFMASSLSNFVNYLAWFMASSLSNFVNYLAEGIHKIKYKYVH